MDKPVTRTWSTPRAACGALVAAGVILAIAAGVASADPGGAVLMGLAAVLLIFSGGSRLVMHPRLSVAPSWMQVATLRGRVSYTPSEITRVRVVSTTRLGRRVPTLEFDLPGDRLLVLGRWDLGSPPEDVLDALADAGFRVS